MKKILQTLALFSLCIAAMPLSAEPVEATEKNFAQIAEKANRPLVIEVYAPWCGACRKMKPRFESAANRYPEVRFVQINIDKEPKLASRYQVTHLPTLLFFLPGGDQPILRTVGLLSQEELNDHIEELLTQSEGAW